MTKLGQLILLLSVFFSPVCLLSEDLSDFSGRWEIIPGKSVDLGTRGGFMLDVRADGNDITILGEKMWRGRDLSIAFELILGGTVKKEITSYRLPDIAYQGIRMKKGDIQTFFTEYSEETSTLSIVETTPVLISQGFSTFKTAS
jgi:hypothetical protein